MGQGFQNGKIHIYQSWLVKSADHILILHEINAGFPADAAVNLGKQRGRYLNKINAAQIGCRGKTGQIADDSTAQSKQDIISVKMILYQRFVQFIYGFYIFA